jgi:DNA-directed RNA polymerase subunit RPC12/RpoP
MTTSVTVQCPSSGCGNSHTVVVDDSGHDRAETVCKACGNRVVVKTRDGSVVSTEAA